jgi:hypothetical protein
MRETVLKSRDQAGRSGVRLACPFPILPISSFCPSFPLPVLPCHYALATPRETPFVGLLGRISKLKFFCLSWCPWRLGGSKRLLSLFFGSGFIPQIDLCHIEPTPYPLKYWGFCGLNPSLERLPHVLKPHADPRRQ